MKVDLIIPNWNGEAKLRKNLPEVLKLQGINQIIVVDDASSDLSVKLLEEEFPQVKLIKRSINGGFSSAVNTGVKASSSELVFFIKH